MRRVYIVLAFAVVQSSLKKSVSTKWAANEKKYCYDLNINYFLVFSEMQIDA